MNQRSINLSPWKEISISTETKHHTLIDIATIIIYNEDDYYVVEDDIEKVMDVSSMPRYIKEDWINYNKKELNQKVLDKHIKVYTDKSEMNRFWWAIQYPPDKEIEEIISTLKSIKRHLLIKKII
jgi:hypothetical protein